MTTERVLQAGIGMICALFCAACGLNEGSIVGTETGSPATTADTPTSVDESATTSEVAAAPTTAVAAAVADDSSARPESVAEMADEAVEAIENENWAALGQLVGAAGLTISVDAYVDDQDLTISAEEIAAAGTDSLVRRWGASEEPGVFFDLTLADQLGELVTIAAVTDTESTSLDERLGVGNVIDNLDEAFPTGSYKEFWNGGVNPAFGGLDWTSLRVVVVDGALRALVQDQWAP